MHIETIRVLIQKLAPENANYFGSTRVRIWKKTRESVDILNDNTEICVQMKHYRVLNQSILLCMNITEIWIIRNASHWPKFTARQPTYRKRWPELIISFGRRFVCLWWDETACVRSFDAPSCSFVSQWHTVRVLFLSYSHHHFYDGNKIVIKTAIKLCSFYCYG